MVLHSTKEAIWMLSRGVRGGWQRAYRMGWPTGRWVELRLLGGIPHLYGQNGQEVLLTVLDAVSDDWARCDYDPPP